MDSNFVACHFDTLRVCKYPMYSRCNLLDFIPAWMWRTHLAAFVELFLFYLCNLSAMKFMLKLNSISMPCMTGKGTLVFSSFRLSAVWAMDFKEILLTNNHCPQNPTSLVLISWTMALNATWTILTICVLHLGICRANENNLCRLYYCRACLITCGWILVLFQMGFSWWSGYHTFHFKRFLTGCEVEL